MFQAETSSEFWAEAMRTANKLRNDTYSEVIKGTPSELFTKTKSKIDRLKVFGCLAYLRIPNEQRKGKLAPRGQPGIMVGYAENRKAWRIAIRKEEQWHIVSSCDVHFVEHKKGYPEITGQRGTQEDLTVPISIGNTRYDPDYQPEDTTADDAEPSTTFTHNSSTEDDTTETTTQSRTDRTPQDHGGNQPTGQIAAQASDEIEDGKFGSPAAPSVAEKDPDVTRTPHHRGTGAGTRL